MGSTHYSATPRPAEDKNYLYQLLADLSEEVNDKPGQIRAMENSLAISGTRRMSVLRECMDLSSRIRGGVFYSNGRGPTNAGNKPFFAFGRRLVGLREVMPPQVLLDLGQAFLDDGDTVSAERTFRLARNHADERSYEREVALMFEKSARREEALERYNRLLRINPSDIGLIARVAKLNEQVGNDDLAFQFYQQGLDLLLSQTPVTTLKEEKEQEGFYWASNRDAYDKYSDQLLRGILVTAPDKRIDELLSRQQALFEETLARLERREASRAKVKELREAPRLDRRVFAMRRMLFAFERHEAVLRLDKTLLARFPEDSGLAEQLFEDYVSRGEISSARNFVSSTSLPPDQREKLSKELGSKNPSASGTARLAPKEMWRLFRTYWIGGDDENALRVLRRLDQKTLTGSIPGQTTEYDYSGGQPEYIDKWESNVYILIKLALALGDEDLALQFARSRLQNPSGSYYRGSPALNYLTAYKDILPPRVFESVAQFALNRYGDEKTSDGIAWLWLIRQLKETPQDDVLLEKVDELKIELNPYSFPFSQAMEIFPESIRTEALAVAVENTHKQMRAAPLITAPFQHMEPISAKVGDFIIESLQNSLPEAMKQNYLSYSISQLPLSGRNRTGAERILANPENADLAMRVLDLLTTEDLLATQTAVANRAIYVKAMLLHEIGRTDDALSLAAKHYDADRSVTDYYERSAKQAIDKTLVPLDPDRFLPEEQRPNNSKFSVAGMEKRIAFFRTLRMPDRLRDEYRMAMRRFPKHEKFRREYYQIEQRAGRTQNLIQIDEREYLAMQPGAAETAKTVTKTSRPDGKPSKTNTTPDKPQAANSKTKPKNAAPKPRPKTSSSKIASLQTKLAAAHFKVSNPAAGLKYWRIADDKDIERFEKESAARSNTTPNKDKDQPPNDKSKADKKSTANSKPKPTKTTKPKPAARGTAPAPPSTAKKVSARPKTAADLKKAIEQEKPEEAAKILRQLWRQFPPVVESPYRIFQQPGRLNRLAWPAAPTKPKSATPGPDESKDAAEAERQRKLRGGLATFDDELPEPPKPPTSQSIWRATAKNNFAEAEMKRLIRSRSASELSGLSEIAIGLLEAAKAETKTDSLLGSLVEQVLSGRAGPIRTLQLLTLISEDPSRIDVIGKETFGSLIRQLNCEQVSQLADLAKLCASTGQREQSRRLFGLAAGRASENGVYYNPNPIVGFETLMEDAKSVSSEKELLDIAEHMQALATIRTATSVEAIVTLREKHDTAEAVCDRSESLFSAVKQNPIGLSAPIAIVGARTFARAGRIDEAIACLRCAVLVRLVPPDPYQSMTPPADFDQKSLRKLFPRDGSGFSGFSEWLNAAASEIEKLFRSGKLDGKTAVTIQLTIACRQLQTDQRDDALRTLGSVDDLLNNNAGENTLLAVDLLRRAGLTEKALQLERKLYEDDRLPWVRYADFLSDVATVDGDAAAVSLFEDLTRVTHDAKLLAAAAEFGTGNSEHQNRVEELTEARQAAERELEQRRTAAEARAETRKKWKQSAADSGEEKTPAKKAK